MDECRNCRSATIKDLGHIGAIAPFVLKRVFKLDWGLAPSRHPVKRLLRRFQGIDRATTKIYGRSILTEVQYCLACSFIQTKDPIPEKDLANLYVDYRSDSYNRERVRYEPDYALVASSVGASEKEIETRRGGLTALLKKHIETGSGFSMLDYGGADGQFLPDLPAQKYVYDISNVAPIPGIEKIADEASLSSYSYVQIAHVLEHVPYPLALTLKASTYLNPGGYLYVELPQDMSDEMVAQIGSGEDGFTVPIHEHINYYTVLSATKLLEAAGLLLTDVHAVEADLGWNKMPIIRALGRKPSK